MSVEKANECIKENEVALIMKVVRDGEERIAQIALTEEQHHQLQMFVSAMSVVETLTLMPKEFDLQIKNNKKL